MATWTGTAAADTWPGSVDNSGADNLNGLGGDDTLTSFAGMTDFMVPLTPLQVRHEVYRVTVEDGPGGVLAAGDAAAVGRDERGGAFVTARVSPGKIGSMPDPCSFPGMKQGVNSPSPAASRGSTNAIARRLNGPRALVGPNVPAILGRPRFRYPGGGRRAGG